MSDLNAAIRRAASYTERNPSEAQKESGNYAKGKVRLHGLEISIENPKGGERSGTDKGGKTWSVKMPAHYGYVKGTEGKDGDHVDVYIGPAPDSSKVFVVDQVDAKSGAFDEHKCMLGYGSKADALADYKKAFSDGKGAERIGSVTELPIDKFKSWLSSGKTKQPMAQRAYAAGGPVMPSKTPKQARFMAAVGHDPAFAAKVGVPMSVGKDFNSADARTGILRRAAGGNVVNQAMQVARRYAEGGGVGRFASPHLVRDPYMGREDAGKFAIPGVYKGHPGVWNWQPDPLSPGFNTMANGGETPRHGYATDGAVEDVPEAELPPGSTYLPHQGEKRLDTVRPGSGRLLKDMIVGGTNTLAENLPGPRDIFDYMKPPLPQAPDMKNLPTREDYLESIGPVKGWGDFAREMGPMAASYFVPTSGPEAKALAKLVATKIAPAGAVVAAGGANDKASPAELDHPAPFEMAEAPIGEFQMAAAEPKKGQSAKGNGLIDMGGWTRENAQGPYGGPPRARDDVKTIQDDMRKRGFFSGESDGVDGGGTRNSEWRMIQADRATAAAAAKKQQGITDLDTAKNDPKNEPFMSNNAAYGTGFGVGTGLSAAVELAFNLAARGKVKSANELLKKAGLPRKQATISDRAANINEFAKRGGAGEEVPYVPAPKTESGWKFDKDSMPATQWFPKAEDPWMSPQNLLHTGFMGGAGFDALASFAKQKSAEHERDAAYADMMDETKHPNGPDKATIGRYVDAKKDAEFWERMSSMGQTAALGIFAGAKLGKMVPKGSGPDTNLAGAEIGNLNKEILKTNKAATAYARKAKAKQEQEAAEAAAKAQEKAEKAAARKAAKEKKPEGEDDSGQGKLLGLAGLGSLLPSPAGEGEEPTLPVSPEQTLAPSLSDGSDTIRKSGGKVEKHYSYYQPRREGKFAGGPVYPQRKHGGRTSQPQGDIGYGDGGVIRRVLDLIRRGRPAATAVEKAPISQGTRDLYAKEPWVDNDASRGVLGDRMSRRVDTGDQAAREQSFWDAIAADPPTPTLHANGGAIRAGLDVSSKAMGTGGPANDVKILPIPAIKPARSVASQSEMWMPRTPVPAEMVPGFLGSKNANDKATGGGVGANNKGLIQTGLVHGPTGGREDARPVSVRSGAYVIPAETVSHLGGGNTLAGNAVLDRVFKKRPMRYGGVNMASGGDVDIKISDGEYLVNPEEVAEIGSGSLDRGHRILDAMIMKLRQDHIRTLKTMPRPAKS